MSILNKILFKFLGWKTNEAIHDAKKDLTKIKYNECLLSLSVKIEDQRI